MIGLIWAQAANGVVGADGGIPWHLPEDLAHFRDTTHGAIVIMGRRTWDSLPARFRPLPGRRNVVLTRRADWHQDGAEVASSLEAALALVPPGQDVWVVGGAEVYRQAIGRADRIVRTELEASFPGDVVAPCVDEGWRLVVQDPEQGWHTSRTGLLYRFSIFDRGTSSDVS